MQNKYNFALLAVALAFAFNSAQAMGQMSKASDLDIQASDIQASFVGNSLTCSQQQLPVTIRVLSPLVERARLKSRLATLLRDSLYDDSRGVVNIEREKEIRKLANKLRAQHD
ncbi:MAG: hypothetical protein ABSH02_14495 [Candidatus Sulfotelmatobacter sp.]